MPDTTVRIIAGALALVVLGIIIYRRKQKGGK
jgi:LPXTG-motif cell wall-anchored protein